MVRGWFYMGCTPITNLLTWFCRQVHAIKVNEVGEDDNEELTVDSQRVDVILVR